MPRTSVIKGFVTPKDKTKSNSLARQKVRILSKSVVSFYSLPVSLGEGKFHSKRATSIKAHMPSHPHLAGDTLIFVLSPTFKVFTRILRKSPAITCILFDGNKIAQTNLFAGGNEKYWS